MLCYKAQSFLNCQTKHILSSPDGGENAVQLAATTAHDDYEKTTYTIVLTVLYGTWDRNKS